MLPCMPSASHEHREGHVPAAFVCASREGFLVSIPEGRCVVEEGQHYAAICWETPAGRERVEIALERLAELIQWKKVQLGPLVPP